MNESTMLEMLRIDLGLTTTKYNDRLSSLIESAKTEIEREGVTLSPSSSVTDANLIIQYASWLWRKRDSGEGMPKMIRWQLNNRLFEVTNNG